MMEEAIGELHGKALKIYVLLASVGRPMSVREIQRRLDLSSPSLVHYYLKKLEHLGLLGRDPKGHYYVKKFVKIGVLRDFLILRHKLVPKYLFYSVFFLVLFIFCALAFWRTTDSGLFFLALTSLAVASASWALEAVKAWRSLPG
mgnify:CR=1 FL=1